jgi:hypothetical protein
VGGMVRLFFPLSLKIVSIFCLVETFVSTPHTKKCTLSPASSCRAQQSLGMVGRRKVLLEVQAAVSQWRDAADQHFTDHS